ncbi:MAG: class I SAM-dependent methyltransferase [Bacteroidales bacterium]|nr:class I SAM-dependent methyltransferase [Bacteroidales bacterium]
MGCTGPCGTVVDFGCGYGTFSIAAAQMTADTVHAIDIDPAMIAATQQNAEVAQTPNVIATLRDFVAEGCGLPDANAGYTMVFNILHLEDPVGLLREAYRVLQPGGRLGILHWKPDPDTPRGPPLAIRPTPAQCRAWAEAAGFQHERDLELCCCSWHYGLVLTKPLESAA